MASEVLSCDIWAIVETVMSNAEDLLVPFWDTILSSHPTPAQAPIPHHSHPLLAGSPQASPRLGVTNMTDERHGSTGEGVSASGGSDTDVQDQTGTGGPGRSVLAGYWAKVNGVFLDKKPREVSCKYSAPVHSLRS